MSVWIRFRAGDVVRALLAFPVHCSPSHPGVLPRPELSDTIQALPAPSIRIERLNAKCKWMGASDGPTAPSNPPRAWMRFQVSQKRMVERRSVGTRTLKKTARGSMANAAALCVVRAGRGYISTGEEALHSTLEHTDRYCFLLIVTFVKQAARQKVKIGLGSATNPLFKSVIRHLGPPT